jgi:hypothetical protein
MAIRPDAIQHPNRVDDQAPAAPPIIQICVLRRFYRYAPVARQIGGYRRAFRCKTR